MIIRIFYRQGDNVAETIIRTVIKIGCFKEKEDIQNNVTSISPVPAIKN
jgi:hypothetical protein